METQGYKPLPGIKEKEKEKKKEGEKNKDEDLGFLFCFADSSLYFLGESEFTSQ